MVPGIRMILFYILFLSFKVYQDSSLAYFIDASDPKYGNWMNFIQCARNQHEQNLKALQYNGCLYFESVRDIPIGEELLVWYDDLQYDLYMGIPIGFRGKAGSSSSSCKFLSNAATPLGCVSNAVMVPKCFENMVQFWSMLNHATLVGAVSNTVTPSGSKMLDSFENMVQCYESMGFWHPKEDVGIR